MCDTCGCGDSKAKITKPGEELHEHEHMHGTHEHSHPHSHLGSRHHDHKHLEEYSHVHEHSKEIILEADIMQKNNLLAERNRGFFEAKKIFALNLVSSPGSGKTSILERTIKELKKEKNIFVIEGDQQTMNDAKRIENAGAPVVQINTGNGCHLDADMINKAAKKLDIKENSILFIENVGNLVCPGEFDLGENLKVVLLSVPEGDDKVAKYPTTFRVADIVLLTKSDLLGILDFDIKKVKDDIAKLNANVTFLEISSKTSAGMDEWIFWLKEKRSQSVGQQARFVTEE